MISPSRIFTILWRRSLPGRMWSGVWESVNEWDGTFEIPDPRCGRSCGLEGSSPFGARSSEFVLRSSSFGVRPSEWILSQPPRSTSAWQRRHPDRRHVPGRIRGRYRRNDTDPSGRNCRCPRRYAAGSMSTPGPTGLSHHRRAPIPPPSSSADTHAKGDGLSIRLRFLVIEPVLYPVSPPRSQSEF